MARLVAPHSARLERSFGTRLRALGFSPAQRESLGAITSGAAALLLHRPTGLRAFLEQVSYRGRRLAKLGLAPNAVLQAQKEFDSLLDAALSGLGSADAANLRWVREQLHFCVVLTLNNAFYQVREAESKAFYELFRGEVESHSLDEMVERFLSTLKAYSGADDARLVLFDQEAPAVKALARPLCFDLKTSPAEMALEKRWKRRFRTCWSVPVHSGGRLRGLLQFAFRRQYDWLPRELELLEAAAERCWMAAEKARLLEDLAAREEQVRRLAGHMVEVEESERRRISRELHDEAGQSLLCVRLQLEMAEQDLPVGVDSVRERLVEARSLTEHSIIEIRRLIAALSPAILEQMGLAAALRQLAGRFRSIHPADIHLRLPRRLDLSKKVEIIVYRIVQECLNNISKYSSASRVNLSVDSADQVLSMHIEDNGIGFDVPAAFARRDCFGLSGLRERVALLGGVLEVQSTPAGPAPGAVAKLSTRKRPPSGTSIRIRLPLSAG
jgi:signal transduction histidine kinase